MCTIDGRVRSRCQIGVSDRSGTAESDRSGTGVSDTGVSDVLY